MLIAEYLNFNMSGALDQLFGVHSAVSEESQSLALYTFEKRLEIFLVKGIPR